MAKRKKRKIGDGFFPELVEGACFFGYMGIPGLMDLKNIEVPKSIIPLNQAKRELAKRRTHAYVHCYLFDDNFSDLITDIESFIELLSHFDGVLTPDCTLLTRQSNCLQATNTYFNRAVGFRLQKAGIPVICHIRWSDESSFDYCFLGAPKDSILAISTYGTVRTREKQLGFRVGLIAMLEELTPTDVLVHGPMPQTVFDGLKQRTRFHHYDDWITMKHSDGGDCDGA